MKEEDLLNKTKIKIDTDFEKIVLLFKESINEFKNDQQSFTYICSIILSISGFFYNHVKNTDKDVADNFFKCIEDGLKKISSTEEKVKIDSDKVIKKYNQAIKNLSKH